MTKLMKLTSNLEKFIVRGETDLNEVKRKDIRIRNDAFWMIFHINGLSIAASGSTNPEIMHNSRADEVTADK